MSTSFPYFDIARSHGIDYGVVLELVDNLERKIRAEGLRLKVWSYSTEFTHEAATAVRDAVVSEYRRRSLSVPAEPVVDNSTGKK